MSLFMLVFVFTTAVHSTVQFRMDVSSALIAQKVTDEDKRFINNAVETLETQLQNIDDHLKALTFAIDNNNEETDLLQRTFQTDVNSLDMKIRHFEALQPDGNTGFILYAFGKNTLFLVNKQGRVLARKQSRHGRIRGMYYNPFTQRILAFGQSVVSYDLSLEDEQIISNKPVSVKTTGSMESDLIKGELYMTLHSDDEIWKMRMNGTGFTKIVTNANSDAPLGSRIDACNGILYWADDRGKAIKSVNVEGESRVTTLYDTTPEFPRSLDVNLHEHKIYWCANSGNLFVFDMRTGNNTQLDNHLPRRGACDSLRQSNGHIYISHSCDRGIRKLALNGTMVEMIFEGGLNPGTNKYFNLLQI